MKKILKKHLNIILIGFLIGILQMYVLTKVQFIKGEVLDTAISQNIESLPQIILKLAIGIVIMSILGFCYSVVNSFFSGKSSQSLREQFFHSFLDCSYKEYFNLDEGEIIAKYSKEISEISRECFSMVGILMQMSLQIVFVAGALFYLDTFFAVLSILILIVPVLVPRLFQNTLAENSKLRMHQVEENISVLDGILSSFEIIKNSRIEDPILKKFKSSNKNLYLSENNFEQSYAVSSGVNFAASLGSQGIILIIAGLYVYYGRFKTGDFLTIAGLVAALRVPLFWISTLFQRVIASKPIIESVFEFIGSHQKEEKEIELKSKESLKVSIENLSYAYNEGNEILENVNIELLQNKKYLIVGESGSGKSTLLNLLLKYDSLNLGRILINNTDIEEITNLEKIITISRQEATIFSGTLRDNLTMQNNLDYSDEELIEILNKVGLEKFVIKGLNYYLEENGSNLSGGEKKRVALARALIRKTPILILDEPLANLDKENISRIEELIAKIDAEILIVISHQLSENLLENFDYIINLKGGREYVEALH